MAMKPPFPDIDEILTAMGEAGARLAEIDASEGAAGNISVYLGRTAAPAPHFSRQQPVALPGRYPALAGGALLVTGSGRRLRDIRRHPAANVGFLTVSDDGKHGTLYTAPDAGFQRLTGELNSHLAAHDDQVRRTGGPFQALIHAQPPHLTFLSQIPAYADHEYLNYHLLRWQPELIIQFPEGIGYVPFLVPGSEALEKATRASLGEHRLVLWAKHGVIARSDHSVAHAADLIEYAEAGARYEYMHLLSGRVAAGLTRKEIAQIGEAFGVETSLFE